MVEIKRETFTVETIGAGQPDYSQPTTAPQALVVKFPEREIAGQRYNDFKQITIAVAQQEYIVGTESNNNRSGSWPTNIVAKEIQFYSLEECYVRFNEADAVPHLIPASLPIRFFSRVTKLYVYHPTNTPTLNIWIEG